MKKYIIVSLLIFTCFSQIFGQNDLDYFRSKFDEATVEKYIKRAYTDTLVLPMTLAEFDNIRTKTIGQTFTDPTFGREWTFIWDKSLNYMNSERNNWNSDGSKFFLVHNWYNTSFILDIFDGTTMEFIESQTVSRPGITSSNVRWMPNDPNKMFYLYQDKVYTYDINTKVHTLMTTFASFTLTSSKIAGFDGNDVASNGDFLIGNGGDDCFVFNLIENKVVRLVNGTRTYLDPSDSITTFSMGAVDYSIVFEGIILEQDEDNGGLGVAMRDINGNVIMSLYKRTPHMDPTFFKDNGILYPGIFVRYNEADADYYSALGYPSVEGGGYFHAWNPQDPTEFHRFDMDFWPSAMIVSGGQHSDTQQDGSAGIVCQHGPLLYGYTTSQWEKRFGECHEHALFSGESTMARRFAHHYLGFEDTYSSSDQPEGWLSQNGDYALIKTKYGWYKVGLAERMTKNEVDAYLNNTPLSYTLSTNVVGQGSISKSPSGNDYEEGTIVTLTAIPGSGWQFDGWSGDLSGTANPANLTMNSNKTVTATFSEIEVPTGTVYQAEDATTLYYATVQTNHLGYTGTGFVDYANQVGSYIEWTVNVQNAGTYPIEVRYSYVSTNNRPMEIKVNGAVRISSLDFQSTADWDTWDIQTMNVNLMAGNNTIRATALSTEGGPNVDKLEIFAPWFSLTTNVVGSGTVTTNPPGGSFIEGTAVAITAVPDNGWQFDGWSGDLSGTINPDSLSMDGNKTVSALFSEISSNDTIYQAEDASLSNATVQNDHLGYTGTGFVDYANQVGGYIEWTVGVADAGNYTVEFRFAFVSTNNRPMEILVNGVVANSSLDFQSTGDWDTWNTQSLNLDLLAGNNTIRATAISDEGGPNVDKLEILGLSAATWVVLTDDDFESGWGNWTDGGGNCVLYTDGTYAHNGNNAADIQDNTDDGSSFYLTNGIDVSTPGYEQIKVEFWFYGVSMDAGEDFFLKYYDGYSYQIVEDFIQPNDFSNDQFYFAEVYIDKTEYNFPTDMKIKFTCDASGGADDVYIDEIKISATKSLNSTIATGELDDSKIVLSELDQAIEEKGEMSIYPNPFFETTTLDYHVENKQLVLFNFYDLRGRKIYSMSQQAEKSGLNSLVLKANEMGMHEAGLYFITATFENKTQSLKIFHKVE